MIPGAAWTKDEANRIRKKAYRFFLRDGYIWKHPKKRNGIPLRVVAKKEEQEELLAAYHDSPWAGHRGTWAMLEKLKGKYWWLGLYLSGPKLETNFKMKKRVRSGRYVGNERE